MAAMSDVLQPGLLWTYLPIKDLLIAILELSSRFHLMVGVGLPVALHFNVMLAPSRTMMSLELSESSMFGGTAIICKLNSRIGVWSS